MAQPFAKFQALSDEQIAMLKQAFPRAEPRPEWLSKPPQAVKAEQRARPHLHQDSELTQAEQDEAYRQHLLRLMEAYEQGGKRPRDPNKIKPGDVVKTSRPKRLKLVDQVKIERNEAIIQKVSAGVAFNLAPRFSTAWMQFETHGRVPALPIHRDHLGWVGWSLDPTAPGPDCTLRLGEWNRSGIKLQIPSKAFARLSVKDIFWTTVRGERREEWVVLAGVLQKVEGDRWVLDIRTLDRKSPLLGLIREQRGFDMWVENVKPVELVNAPQPSARVTPTVAGMYKPEPELDESAGHDVKSLDIALCPRCAGGELPNCPVCDGTGFQKKTSASSERAGAGIRLSPQIAGLSGEFRNPWTFGKRRTDAYDHESEGRTDPLSGSRDLSMNVADGGRVGSMPLYDDFDE